VRRTTKSASPQPSKKAKKSKSKAKTAELTQTSDQAQDQDGDEHMTDAAPTPASKIPSKTAPQPPANLPLSDAEISEAFASIYLRKVTAELGDDLDKVRVAQDFNANSIPMLVKALSQGSSVFAGEEKRRVVAAATAGG
jgi:ribosome assembly protein 3